MGGSTATRKSRPRRAASGTGPRSPAAGLVLAHGAAPLPVRPCKHKGTPNSILFKVQKKRGKVQRGLVWITTGWPDTGRTWFMAYGLRACAGEWEARAWELSPRPAEQDHPLANGGNKTHTHAQRKDFDLDSPPLRSDSTPRSHIYHNTAPRGSGYALEAATHQRRRPPRVRVSGKTSRILQKKKTQHRALPVHTKLRQDGC
jgi:hypothetical protein